MQAFRRTLRCSQREYNVLVSSLTMLVQVAPKEAARKMLQQAEQVLLAVGYPEKEMTTMRELVTANAAIGKNFPLQTIVDVDGQKLIFLDQEPKPVLLSFVVVGEGQDTIGRLNSFTTQLTSAIEDEILRFVVIFVGEDKTDEWSALSTWIKDNPKVTLIHVRADNNQELFDACPIPWSPSWVVIDKEGVLQEFNPLFPVLRSRLHRYVN